MAQEVKTRFVKNKIYGILRGLTHDGLVKLISVEGQMCRVEELGTGYFFYTPAYNLYELPLESKSDQKQDGSDQSA